MATHAKPFVTSTPLSDVPTALPMDAQLTSPAVRSALLVVDMQHDFVDLDGMLSVPGAQAIVQRINALMTEGCWDLIVASKDWQAIAARAAVI